MGDSAPPLVDAVLGLAERHWLVGARDVALGPWLAPVAIAAHDAQGVKRDVLIAVEVHEWSPPVIRRMAEICRGERDRLRQVAGADFVALVVPGQDPAPGALTSMGELDEFLAGFAPPVGKAPRPALSQAIFQAPPISTVGYEVEALARVTSWTGKGLIFCAMPFAESFLPVFLDLVVPAVAQAGLVVRRTDREERLDPILHRIQDGIRNADLVVADITGHNPNVMFEVGLARAMGKATLLLRQDRLPLPFDLQDTEVLEYPGNAPGTVCGTLATRLRDGCRALWR